MVEPADNTVRASDTTFDVVEALGEKRYVGVTALAEHMGVPKSTVHNHLQTLRKRGYVVKDGSKYRLSLDFLHLGETARQYFPLYRVARTEIDELAVATGIDAYLVIEEMGRGVIVYCRKETDIDLGHSVGSSLSLTSTAAGKAILAQLPAERTRAIIEEYGLPAVTERSITDEGAMYDELEAIRERGYSLGKGEQVEGVRSIGAAITGPDGRVHGAVSISGPERFMERSNFEREKCAKVLEAVNVVELKLVSQE